MGDREAARAEEPLLASGALVESFKVIRLLGRGGMGEVYLARDTRLGRKVALKVIHPDALGDPEAQARFQHEAQITARFNHPHIVMIYSVGAHLGNPFVALEYLEGENLRERLDGERPGLREAMRIGLDIAEALAEAHRNDVLHRDLKPQNVFLPRDGRLRVLDFGLAKVNTTVEMEEARTLAGARAKGTDQTTIRPVYESAGKGVKGTALYMSPEQWAEKPALPASDVWALGLILHELVSGLHPFAGLGFFQICLRVSSVEPVPSVASVAPDLPAPLVRLIDQCLEKSADRRPTATQVVGCLTDLLSTGRSVASPSEQSPFRGLLPFTEENAGQFFGRAAEVAAFVERMREEPVLPVVGPSGAGKSSFLLAGVVPRLRDQGDWLVVRLRPGNEPFVTLASRLVAAELGGTQATSLEPRTSPGTLRGSTAPGREAAEGIRAHELEASPSRLALQLLELAERRRSRVLLFVDQLEEVFTLGVPEPTRIAFLRALCSAADDPSGPVRAVFTLRDDFLGRLAVGDFARDVLSRVTVLGVPGPVALTEVLERPLEPTGYRFEDPELVQEMTRAVQGEPAALPLLQFVAQELWSRRDPKARLLTRAAYSAAGGVEGAIAQHADAVMAGLSSEQEQTARSLLLRLVTAAGTRGIVPRSQLLEGLGPEADKVLERLTQSRTVLGRKGRSEAEFELVHESLIRTWTRLRRWLDESREERIFLAELEQAATLWERRGCPADEVWQGPALVEAQRKLERCSEAPAHARRFLEAGARRQARRVRIRRAGLAAAASILVLVAAGSLLAAYVISGKEQEAQRQRRRAQLTQAEAQREGARAAYLRNDLIEARAKLRSSLETADSPLARALWWRMEKRPLQWQAPLGDSSVSVAFSPDGRQVAVGSQDRAIYLFDVDTGSVRVLRGHEDQVMGIAFSPDGRLLASGSWNGAIRIWELATGGFRLLRGHTDAIWSLAFSPDGQLLASGSQDRSIRLWRVSPGTPEFTLAGHEGRVWSVVFSSGGRLLASGSADGQVRLWNVETGQVQLILRGHVEGVQSVSFNPDDTLLASGSRDKTIRLWQVATGRELRVIRGHEAAIGEVKFGPDGLRLASGSVDRTIRFWNAETGAPGAILRGHTAAVRSIAFSPDGRLLASVGLDRTVRVWRTRSVGESGEGDPGHRGGALAVAMSPDGRLLATGGIDSTVRIWQRDTGRMLRVVSNHATQVSHLAFSPDGALLASAGADYAIHVVRVATGETVRSLMGHTGPANAVAFSPDGLTLASASSDATVRLWALPQGTPLGVLRGHRDLVSGLAFSRDGKLLASTGEDRTVRLWSLPTGKPAGLLTGHTARVFAAAFSPDGRYLATSSFDQTLRLWDLVGGGSRVVGRQPGRIYWLTFHPDGRRIGTTGSDGLARLWPVEGEGMIELKGHRGEVNGIAFSADGQWVTTAGDDGTVRLWSARSGRPQWEAPYLGGDPVSLLTQRGWTLLGAPRAGGNERWRQGLEGSARRATDDPSGAWRCVATHDGHLEGWEPAAARRRFRRPFPGVLDVVPLRAGCAVLCGDVAWRVDPAGEKHLLDRRVTAILADRDEILVATGERVHVFGSRGQRRADHAGSSGITALARTDRFLVAGFSNGSLELLPLQAGARRPGFAFEDVPSSPVVRIVNGPAGTIVAGFANGFVGLWTVSNGTLLEHARLHGPVVHLVLREGKLHAASELGDHRTWDLGVFDKPYCGLMRDVWKAVPVVWRSGLPAVTPPPRRHPCSPP
jgi:WD40 repeat protein/serine/threonine protein kinase